MFRKPIVQWELFDYGINVFSLLTAARLLGGGYLSFRALENFGLQKAGPALFVSNRWN
jgi:hypothetical protein